MTTLADSVSYAGHAWTESSPFFGGRTPRVGGEKKMEIFFTKFGENFRESLNFVINVVRKSPPNFLKTFFVK